MSEEEYYRKILENLDKLPKGKSINNVSNKHKFTGDISDLEYKNKTILIFKKKFTIYNSYLLYILY